MSSQLPDPWPTPRAPGPLDAVVAIPGSKSLTNRYLVLAALASGPTRLVGPLHSRDTELMMAALTTLGSQLETLEGGDVLITPQPVRGPATVHCGLAGTVMRFVPPVAALANAPVIFDGDDRARERPMSGLVQGLQGLGVRVTAPDGSPSTTLPIRVEPSGQVAGGLLKVDAAASSQFISALLMVAPRFQNGLDLVNTSHSVPSLPHIEMTLNVLRQRGVRAETVADNRWRVWPGAIAGGEVVVEPDLSNATPFLAAALILGGTVRIPHWPADSTYQPSADIIDILTRMGATIHRDTDGVLTLTGTGSVRGIDVDLSRVGELTPTIAALATVATGPSRLRGVAHLRGHETDRLAALAREINRLGVAATEQPDGLLIEPGPAHGAVLESYADHRMATFAAIVGLAIEGVSVRDIATTAKTLPDFPAMWTSMLATSGA